MAQAKTPTPKKATTPAKARKRTLDARERRFVDEYLVSLDVARAALAAGYSLSMAKTKAFKWVSESTSKPHVYAAIAEAKAKRAEKVQITAEDVLRRYWAIATANPNELMQNRHHCCRYCYGQGHDYQWADEAEWRDAVRRAKRDDPDSPPPGNDGGYGYDEHIRPHPLCPRCKGDGYSRTWAADTRHLSEGGAALYAGIKETKYGIEVKTHDQLAALQMVGRHLGMFNDKLTLKGDEENPLQVLLAELGGRVLKPVAKPQREPDS
jgi:phage terminase small subunit